MKNLPKNLPWLRLIFKFLITPAAWILRQTGWSPMELAPNPRRATYWHHRER